MGTERTLSIIKPDAIAKDVIGQIYDRFERAGLRIVAAKMVHLDRARAEAFYAVHRERPFFGELVDFMTSGPVMVQVLEGEGAIDRHREVMGATNPAEAAPGTIRADFACEITENAVHGSDGPDTAASEITFSPHKPRPGRTCSAWTGRRSRRGSRRWASAAFAPRRF
jgi:nucleoside-diphosphate kinase